MSIAGTPGRVRYKVPARLNIDVRAEVLANAPIKTGAARSELGAGSIDVDVSQLPDRGYATIRLWSNDAVRTDANRWNPDAERSTDVRIRKETAKVKLASYPGVLVFSDSLSTQNLCLENRGNVVIHLQDLYPPSGFRFGDSQLIEGARIVPGQKVVVEVTRESGGESVLALTDTQGQTLTQVKLFTAPARGVHQPKDFVVGIDFGTSNTSVFCMETRSKNVEPVALAGDGKARRETALFAPRDHPELWQAISLEGAAKEDRIYNLKTLVRQDNDPFVDELLKFYFKQLLRRGITAYLAERNPDDERPVEFVFTIPVLDGEGNEQNIAYRERVLSAARAAGFESQDENDTKDWTISTMLEPYAGALEVVCGGLFARTIADGHRILVVDSGGGTTDVTLGRVRLRAGVAELEEVRNYSGTVAGDQFGGERATYWLGMTWAASAPDGSRAALPDEVEAARVKQLIDRGWLDTSRFSDRDATTKAGTDGTVGTTIDELTPHEEPTHLRAEMRNAKHMLSDAMNRAGFNDREVHPYEFRADPRGAGAETWAVGSSQLHRAVDPDAHAVTASIVEALRKEGISTRDVHHVFVIGGSARLPHLRQRLAEEFGETKLVPLGDYVDVAVCRGATRLHQVAPSTLPLGFSMTCGKDTVAISSPGSVIARSRRISRYLEVPPSNEEVTLRVNAFLESGSFPFFELTIPAGFCGDYVSVISMSSLQISLEPSDNAQKEMAFSINFPLS